MIKKTAGKYAPAIETFLEATQNSLEFPIIVEGKNDQKALMELGFLKIYVLKGPIIEFCEMVEDEEVAVLTDLDAEGKRLYSKIKEELTRTGVRVNDKLRNLLLKTDVDQIEGLSSYIERHEQGLLLKKKTAGGRV